MTRRLIDYVYDACGLGTVILTDFPVVEDDSGEAVITIPNINALHRVLTEAVALRPGPLSSAEIRFLRSEMGLTQAELARLLGRDGQTVGRWERGETTPDRAAEALIRALAFEHADSGGVPARRLAERALEPASTEPIRIQADDPDNYRPLAA